jgi:hypothetical protein
MKNLLSLTASIFLLAIGQASAANKLSPRAEVNVRAGSERSILMTEFWAPLAQQSDRVLYGDLRLMGDDDSNREGNLGFGYRQIEPQFNSVLGGNIWIDRRRTENGNNFHQLTLGVESLGDKVDLRANGYIQLNSAKTTITPNIGSTTPYLAGSSIFIDTNGFIVEEPQDGFDAEIGYRLPIFQKYIDTTRIYAGGYHFFGDTTDNVTGFRLRGEAQVNSIFSVGARFQHDGPRGSQGFLEATLRFPFKSKKLFQQDGLRSRLDESPERDIDIVTGSKVDTGLMKPVLNASGTEQRILYVDNTNVNTGDGTKENPFNTLVAAQAALQANDILYVNHGDGTTTGMNQGIVIDKANVQLIGSGSAFSYAGYTLLSAGQAPLITNIESIIPGDEIKGNGITVLADNALVTGLNILGVQAYGIRIAAVGAGTFFNSATIINNIVNNNNLRGIIVHTQDNGQIDNVIIDGNTTANNNLPGIHVQANTGQINNIHLNNNFSNNNKSDGVQITSVNGGKLGLLTAENNILNGNLGNGIQVAGSLSKATLNNNISNNNSLTGNYISLVNGFTIDALSITNSTALNNGQNGAAIIVNSGTINSASISDLIVNTNNVTGLSISLTNGSIGNLNIANIIANNNNNNGINISANSNGAIGNTIIANSTSNNNVGAGLVLFTRDAGIINSAGLSNIVTNNNTSFGTFIQSTLGGKINQAAFNNLTSIGNTSDGLRFDSKDNGSLIAQISTNNVTTTNNRWGVYLTSSNFGTINQAALSGITSSNNTQTGLAIDAQTSSVMSNISVFSNNLTANTVYGIQVNDDTAGTFLVDLGGGTLNSIGQNRIFGNTNSDIRVDVDGGQLKAQNNWWGVNTGLPGGKVSYEDASTIDSTAFLTTDPRP